MMRTMQPARTIQSSFLMRAARFRLPKSIRRRRPLRLRKVRGVTAWAQLLSLVLAVDAASQTLRAQSQTDRQNAAQALRADFLKVIDRPRVPLAAEASPIPRYGSYAAERFSFAAEKGERVIGMLVKRGAWSGRRPAVIVLHGTGASKKEESGLLLTIADRG